MLNIVERIIVICDDPVQLANFLMYLMAWNAINTLFIILAGWNISDIIKAIRREWPTKFIRL